MPAEVITGEILPPQPRLKLVEMPKRDPTPQQQVAGQFMSQLNDIENFVVFAHTKDGRLLMLPCVDTEIGPWGLVDACRAKVLESTTAKLGARPALA